MRPLTESVPAQFHQLLNDRQHWIADLLGRFLEFRHVDLVDRAIAYNLRRRLLWNDPQLGLCARKRRLKIEIFLNTVLVREHTTHCASREYVAKYCRIEDRGGH